MKVGESDARRTAVIQAARVWVLCDLPVRQETRKKVWIKMKCLHQLPELKQSTLLHLHLSGLHCLQIGCQECILICNITIRSVVKQPPCLEVPSSQTRSMIGYLMYLTASRPDIMFAVCLVQDSRHSKVSHQHAVIKGSLEEDWSLGNARKQQLSISPLQKQYDSSCKLLCSGTPDQSAVQASVSQRTAEVQGTDTSQRTAEVQGTDISQRTAEVQGTANSQGTAKVQGTADFQGTAEPHDAASIPKSPNDYTPTDAFQTSGGDEGLLDIYALNREVRRLKK
ncbi:hypothetical protein Tco_0088877 [Tanacetum coccineum]